MTPWLLPEIGWPSRNLGDPLAKNKIMPNGTSAPRAAGPRGATAANTAPTYDERAQALIRAGAPADPAKRLEWATKLAKLAQAVSPQMREPLARQIFTAIDPKSRDGRNFADYFMNPANGEYALPKDIFKAVFGYRQNNAPVDKFLDVATWPIAIGGIVVASIFGKNGDV